ncbi:MAG: response regulator [Desulfomonile tiedjei]|nr:response regulator [Desulfomonile tiedjei]
MSRVLIVDDNAMLAFFTARNLQREIEGLEVITAASVAEAKRAVQQNRPSVVIVDVRLTDGCGIDLVRELTKLYPEIAGILISGDFPPESVRHALFGFLLKPYEAEAIVDMVRQALAGNASSEERSRPSQPLPCHGYDRHKMQNRLAVLLAGLRTLGADLDAQGYDPRVVKRILHEDIEELCATVMEISHGLPICPAKGPDNGSQRPPL